MNCPLIVTLTTGKKKDDDSTPRAEPVKKASPPHSAAPSTASSRAIKKQTSFAKGAAWENKRLTRQDTGAPKAKARPSTAEKFGRPSLHAAAKRESRPRMSIAQIKARASEFLETVGAAPKHVRIFLRTYGSSVVKVKAPLSEYFKMILESIANNRFNVIRKFLIVRVIY